MRFAYWPFNNSRFVIPESYGIFYNPMSEYDDQIDARDLGLSPPFRATYVFNAPAGVPTVTWANPFPGTGTTSSTSYPLVYGITPNFHAGYEQNWNFTTEWEALHNTVPRTSYLGSKGPHLPITIDVNEPVLGPGTIQNLRQYQPFGDIYLHQSRRNDILNQAQVGVTHRTGHGLEFGFEYSFTKDLTPNYNGVLPYDSYNVRLDRANSPRYSRNYLVANYIYNLPIGRGGLVLNNVSSNVNRRVGGWQIAGIIKAASGHYVCIRTNSKEPVINIQPVLPAPTSSATPALRTRININGSTPQLMPFQTFMPTETQHRTASSRLATSTGMQRSTSRPTSTSASTCRSVWKLSTI